MPKIKTNRAAAKRFKKTGTGKLKRNKAYKSHILTKKSTKRKRNLRQSTIRRWKQQVSYFDRRIKKWQGSKAE